MKKFSYPIQIRWADIDANRHLRHSVYYDYGASVRMAILADLGLSMERFEELQMGPILFREEALFKREILFGDALSVDVELLKATADFSRWSLRHQFIKSGGTLAAIVTVDGAWIDLQKRKLATPAAFIKEAFGQFPKSPDFEFMPQSLKM
jgi:acyl-CoA thioester hydrolase